MFCMYCMPTTAGHAPNCPNNPNRFFHITDFGVAGTAIGESIIAEKVKEIEELKAELKEAHREIAALRGTLRDAKENLKSWGGYASDYFKEKWDLEGDLKSIDDALARESK